MLSVLLICAPTFAAETNWTSNANTTRVNTIGKALLSKNGLPTKVTFQVIETDEVNAYANSEKEICVFTGLLKYVSNDSELAGVIAHEIGHIVNNHVAKQTIINSITTSALNLASYSPKMSSYAVAGAYLTNSLAMKKVSRTEEYEADITGADLMIKAGYNPLAMVSFLYKISGNYVDFNSDHPSGDKRTMHIYDYITYTYPDKAKGTYNSDSFKQFMEYATPIIQKRNSNPKKLAKFNKKQEKLKQKRLAKLKKYKNANATSGWDTSLNLLKSFAE